MPDLSFLIPARNEQFLRTTVMDILGKCRGDTEVIAVLDGAWPDDPLPQMPRLRVIYHPVSIGQRAATNEAARVSRSKYICKIDAHCSVAEGFDEEVVRAGELLGHDVTQVPRMYNLHVFDWVCVACGYREYQGRQPETCPKCGHCNFTQDLVWKPRERKLTDFARFDKDLHFQYWRDYHKRPEAAGDYPEVMSSIGACFVMRRKRFFELDGLDERHGSWGQFGTEIACKSWLSGGRMVTNRKTWFAHLFRTSQGFSFPYPMTFAAQENARKHSRQLWFGGEWRKAVRPLKWLVDKFAPVPGWEDLPSKSAVYYTDGRPALPIVDAVKTHIQAGMRGSEIVSVSLVPMSFGNKTIVMGGARGALTMFRQILAGLEAATGDIVFLVEHDVLYHPTHFEFVPPRKDAYYYNENTWKVDAATGRAVFYYTKQTSGLCAYRQLLVDHYRARVARVEADGFKREMGFEPGCHAPPRGIDDYPAIRWMSPFPNVDIRHDQNFTLSRWSPEEFRDPQACQGWKMADEIPGWGVTRNRFWEFLQELRP